MKEETKNVKYYLNCALGGALSCGLTHTAIVPIDVAKCRIQVYPDRFRGLIPTLSKLVKNEGLKTLRLGWAPTLVGYSAQGALKYSLYEYFKDLYSSKIKTVNKKSYKGLIWLSASATAEFFADIALCPMEMVKLKMQTCLRPHTRSNSFLRSVSNMYKYRSETKFPFGSIKPLWSRQLPYTMAKFYFFERINQLFYDKIFTKPKALYSKKSQLGITFLSGYLSGIICAAVSHPADTIISQLGKTAYNTSKRINILSIIKEIGLKNLCTAGLGTRIIMIGTLTGMQWWVYDSFKTMIGLDTSGKSKVQSQV
ncbi:mitochondrial phosphate translocator [Cryptosporidium ubiquitum]|uniref:Mitochondrial phosphate translocator n=1 Tax=Cryptosporidium ubiquitum TaxID=857276 RepID=A0A1J4MG46_9CRYT|nr:mitochondrial phosphate translocator [Cryptosporidium ubiquitum]OII72435.1 mitochondrial phosphate translocator [Cryptosporidium ubiquitum]